MRNELTLPVCYDRQRPAPVLMQTCPQPSGSPLPGKIWDMGSSNSQSVNAWWVAALFFPEEAVSGSGPLGTSASRKPLLFSLSPYYPYDNAEHLETLEKHDTPSPLTISYYPHVHGSKAAPSSRKPSQIPGTP